MVDGEKIDVYFADPDLSDVCLVVGDKAFHVHKMSVANRSNYFKALFYSDFKEKNESLVKIEADPVAFQRMLEFIYNSKLSDKSFLTCPKQYNNVFWDQANALWTVLDRFDCGYGRDLLLQLLKTSVCPMTAEYITYNQSRQAYKCAFCADRFLFAAKHGIDFPDCSYYGVCMWIRNNPSLPSNLPDLKKVFSKITP